MMSKDLPLISVVVPIYNVSAYLGICLDSILGQSYTHLDIILIDDGSTDESGRIADEYARLDGRIRVIHQKNQGQSVARNVGLSLAQGDYISFVDSDDWLELDMYSELVEIIVAQPQLDIVKFLLFKKAKHLRKRGQGRLKVYEGAEVLQGYLDEELAGYACTGLYRADVAKSLTFVEGYYCEDVHYTLSLFSRSDIKVALVDRRYYHYRVGRPGSTSSKGTRLVWDMIHLWTLLLNPEIAYPRDIERLLMICYVRFLWTEEKVMLRCVYRREFSAAELRARQEAIDKAWSYAHERIMPYVGDIRWDLMSLLYLRYPRLFWMIKRPILYVKYKKYLYCR